MHRLPRHPYLLPVRRYSSTRVIDVAIDETVMDSRNSEKMRRLSRHEEILRLWEEDIAAYDDLQKRYEHELAVREKVECQLSRENERCQKLEEEVKLLREQLDEAQRLPEIEVPSYFPDILHAQWQQRRSASIYSDPMALTQSSIYPAALVPRNRHACIFPSQRPCSTTTIDTNSYWEDRTTLADEQDAV